MSSFSDWMVLVIWALAWLNRYHSDERDFVTRAVWEVVTCDVSIVMLVLVADYSCQWGFCAVRHPAIEEIEFRDNYVVWTAARDFSWLASVQVANLVYDYFFD